MDTRTDSDLITAYAATRDDHAFAELVARHQQMVYRICLRKLRHHQEAEDATQAVFLVLLNKAGRLTRKGELTCWLYGVAMNVCREARRKRVRCQEEAMRDETEELAVVENHPDHEAVLPFLDEELAGLSAVLRQAVALRYLQGHSQAEAARHAGCSEVTLSVRASRGIERLRRRLAKRGVTLSGASPVGLLALAASASVPKTLLPSILAAVKSAAATTATATSTTTPAGMLAQGAMKAMFIAQVKTAAMVTAAAIVLGGGILVAGALAAAPGEGSKTGETPKTSQPQTAVASQRDGIETIHTVMVNAGTSWIVGALRPDGTVEVRMGGSPDVPWADIQLASQARQFNMNSRVYDQTKSWKLGPLTVTDEMARRLVALNTAPDKQPLAPAKKGSVLGKQAVYPPSERWQFDAPFDAASRDAFTAVEQWLRAKPEARAAQAEGLRQKVQLAVAAPAAEHKETFQAYVKAAAAMLTAEEREEFAKWAETNNPRKPRGTGQYLSPEWRGDKIIEGQRIIAKQGALTLDVAQGASLFHHSPCRRQPEVGERLSRSYSQRRQEGIRPEFLAGDATLTIDLSLPKTPDFDVRNSIVARDLQTAIDRGVELTDIGLTEEQTGVVSDLCMQIKEFSNGPEGRQIGTTNDEVKALKTLLLDVVAARPTRQEAEAALLATMGKISTAKTANHTAHLKLLTQMTAVLKPENVDLLKEVLLTPPPVKSQDANPPATKP